ncbi:MAG: hypothetical protein ACRD2T_08590, partial [Thermoanaerobaculia bacterium]
ENLIRAGVDYRAVDFPNCRWKIERSLDIDWNYIRPDAARMRRIADIFAKVEQNLDALRAWERRQRPEPRPAPARGSRREVIA